LQIHLISTISSGNARLWICTMVLANTGLPEKTSWRHLTLPCSEGCIHICHKQQLIYDVIHRCAVLCQHLLDVCVGLAHLRLHISPTNYIALIVMAHLPGDIDGIVNFGRLTITILFLPDIPRDLASLLIVILLPLELQVQRNKVHYISHCSINLHG
jgi:hypothetical protein